MASIKCTKCGAVLKTQNPIAPGKKVKCPKCTETFVVEAEEEEKPAPEPEEEKEEAINMSDVPAAVQKTFNDEAAGGKIVRVEKEESNYEAVIEKDGKQTGVEVSADGKVVSRHDEKKEHKEKGEKDEKY